MIYTVGRIIKDVRICLDENRIDTALFADGDEDTLQLDEVIRSKVVEAVDRVHMSAPYHLLEQGHNFNEDTNESDTVYPYGIHWADQESGWVLLPDDFLRMVVFEMSDWERPVYTAITPADPLYAKQRSRVKAIRGTSQRPVCAVVVRPEGKALEFYSCKSEEAIVSKAVYIPQATIESDTVDISERCYRAVVYTIAALVLEAYGETERAATFFETANNSLT